MELILTQNPNKTIAVTIVGEVQDITELITSVYNCATLLCVLCADRQQDPIAVIDCFTARCLLPSREMRSLLGERHKLMIC